MTTELHDQLAEYGRSQRANRRPVGLAELTSAASASTMAPDAPLDQSTESSVSETCGNGSTVFDLRAPTVSPASPPRKRRAAVLAVAAAVLLVVGVVVVADRNDTNLETGPVPAASTPQAVPSPTPPEPTPPPEAAGPPPSVVDSLGYRWTRVPHDEAVFGVDSADFDPVMTGVIAGGPGLVAVGTDGSHYESEGHLGEFGDAAVWTSVDGLTWSRVPHDAQVFEGSLMTHVTARGPDLVAVGRTESGAVVWTSVDGLTWSRVPLAEEMFRGSEIHGLTAGGPGLVAVGSFAEETGGSFVGAAVWTSVDGLTWSRVPHNEATFGADAEQWMNSVIVGGPGLVAVGWFAWDSESVMDQGPAVWTSVDGLTWSRVPFDRTVWDYGNVASLVAVESGLVAVGTDYRPWVSDRGGRVWTSPDGITWSRAPHEEFFSYATITSVTVGGPGLVAVGDTFRSDSEGIVWTAALEN